MKIRPLLTAMLLLGGVTYAFSQSDDIQNFRTLDGSHNNLENPRWGAAGENLLRATSIGYEDRISSPAGSVHRPNPRHVSNTLFAQDGLLNEPMNLSDYTWVFGQFIDHDIGITHNGPEPAFIRVPKGDPMFDPQRTGQVVIPMMRNAFDPTTGTGPNNPRQHPNMITAFIDGSAVYGSDEHTANWLRTFSGGKLKTSVGNLLPYNTITGEREDELDPEAPEMADDVGFHEKLFVAGDVRANENPLLLSLHTLFVREHNRLCDELATVHPDWTDEMLYQHARKIVGGIIQAITYREWLPVMGVQLPEYEGYDAEVNPGLMNVFTAAAFRMGHTLLSGEIMRMGEDGEIMPEGNMSLRDGFFNPTAISESGLDPFLRGMGVQTQQSFDTKMVDDVRNFLFGPPGAGGLDLAAININRGRERGLPDYNTVRADFGLPRVRVFAQINSDFNVWARMMILYHSPNWVDPWVGMLAETRMPGALFGETVMTVMKKQFSALRDGDRFFYLNDPVLSEAEKEMIKNTKFRDVIMRNSGIVTMQENVFEATKIHVDCDELMPMAITVSTEEGTPVPAVSTTISMGSEQKQLMSDEGGKIDIEDVPMCEEATVALAKSDEVANGVTTYDLIMIQRHILGVELLPSPYKIIASDVNKTGSVSTMDLLHLRKVILGIDKAFPDTKVWRFIPSDYQFDNPSNPFGEQFPEDVMTVNGAEEAHHHESMSFIGLKLGDVNGSMILTPDDTNIEPRNYGTLNFAVDDIEMVGGETYEVTFSADLRHISGFQFALKFDNRALTVEAINNNSIPGLKDDNFAIFEDRGLITTSWNTTTDTELEEGVFTVVFRALKSGRVSNYVAQSDKITKGEAYNTAFDPLAVNLEFNPVVSHVEEHKTFELYQNEPNPFHTQTTIPFYLPKRSEVTLQVFDGLGRLVLSRDGQFERGMNQWRIDRKSISSTGIFYYTLKTDVDKATKEMVLE